MDRDVYAVQERIFALLMIRLDRLVQRGIPLRNVSAGPVHNSARLRFGDGTTLIVRSVRPGSSGAFVAAILGGRSVLLEGSQWRDDALVLTLAVPARRRTVRHHVVLLGGDQPD